MDIGMPTLIETENIDYCVKLCKALNLNFIELNMNLPEYQTDAIDIQRFNEISKNENIYFTIHLDENLNVCDFNNNVSNAYIKTVIKTVEIAKQLNIPILNMHLCDGVYFTMPNEKIYLFDQYIDTYIDKVERFKNICEEQIGDSDIKICIENTCWANHKFMLKAIDVLLQSRVFGLTFDIGHNHSMGGGDEKIIRKNIDRLCHMHAHDAVGKKNHLALGTGELNVRSYFELAGQHNCRVVLETKTISGLKQSCDWVRKYIPDNEK